MNGSKESTVCSSAPLHILLDTIPEGLFSVDLEGHCTFANRVAARMLGYEAEMLLGRDMHALILHSHADGLPYPRSRSPLCRAARTGQKIHINTEVFWHKDGSALTVEYTCQPLVEAGKVQGVVVTFTDATVVERLACKNAALLKANEALQFEVTERKRAEAAVRVSETRFRTQFEQSPVSMQILSPDGWTLRVNRAWEKLFGLTLADVAGYNMLEDRQLIEKGIMPYVLKGFAGDATTIPPVLYDAAQTFAAGRECWTQSFIYPVKDETGCIREVVLIHQDVTALKRAEQLARQQTEALTRTLNFLAIEPELDKFLGQVLTTITEQLNAPSSTLWFYDPATDAISLHMGCYDSRIFPGTVKTGTRDSVVIAYDVHDCTLWNELVRTRQPVAKTLDEFACNSQLSDHYPWLTAQKIQSILMVPLLVDQQIIGVLSVHNTERTYFLPEETELAQALAQQASLAVQLTRLAKQAQQSAVIEERNRLAREIHDTLAQGLTGIIVQLQAAEDVHTADPEDRQAHIDRARTLARESLMEARRSVRALRPQALEAADLYGALSSLIKQKTSSTGIEMTCQLLGTPYLLPEEVENNLLRIAGEAITNALRHAQATRICLELTYENSQVRLSVQDNGLGFDPELPVLGGFGLIGMQERVRLIGAQLTISSRPEGGSMVAVMVALDEAPPT